MSDSNIKDVSDKVYVGSVDDEQVPIHKCLCGATFYDWTETLSIYSDRPWECPKCKAKLIFRNEIKVYQLI